MKVKSINNILILLGRYWTTPGVRRTHSRNHQLRYLMIYGVPCAGNSRNAGGKVEEYWYQEFTLNVGPFPTYTEDNLGHLKMTLCMHSVTMIGVFFMVIKILAANLTLEGSESPAHAAVQSSLVVKLNLFL